MKVLLRRDLQNGLTTRWRSDNFENIRLIRRKIFHPFCFRHKTGVSQLRISILPKHDITYS